MGVTKKTNMEGNVITYKARLVDIVKNKELIMTRLSVQ